MLLVAVPESIAVVLPSFWVLEAINPGYTSTGHAQSGLPTVRGLEDPYDPTVRHSEAAVEDLRLAGECWNLSLIHI